MKHANENKVSDILYFSNLNLKYITFWVAISEIWCKNVKLYPYFSGVAKSAAVWRRGLTTRDGEADEKFLI